MTKTPLILFSESMLMKSKHHMFYDQNLDEGKIRPNFMLDCTSTINSWDQNFHIGFHIHGDGCFFVL
jgi:hypothetical protein